MNVCDKNICAGCFACINICPKQCISMEENEFGEIYPVIDEDRCIQCNMCKKVCPSLKERLEFKYPKTAYAMFNKIKEEKDESTSGGIASLFYKKILSENGVVYGVANLFNNKCFKFIRIEDEKDLFKVKGSKYVHAYTEDAFKRVKNDLIDGRKVLFIGTPCQISGLKSFLMKDYNNLILVDIVCHGVPSQKLLFDELEKLKIDKKNVRAIYFRDREKEGFHIKILSKNNESLYYEDASQNDYYKNFHSGNILRENCYSCRYARNERISDITIGDFWGIEKESTLYKYKDEGISLVMPITSKGVELINSIKNDCIFDERSIREACNGNLQLNAPSIKSKKYNLYRKYYPKYGYNKTLEKMVLLNERIKVLIKKNKMIYSILRKIKNG